MTSVSLKLVEAEAREIPYQDASYDIWDKKYRLKAKDGAVVDESMDATFCRVARALAEVEATPEKRQLWFERFLWALRHGAIPAGRVVSNAGAQAHKPATSTINCTVSGTIEDSMDDILAKVHEAGLTLKAGCGIGYEFSTLRPRGAYVSGAGAYTSGPLSFMDIYDKMCFTVSSAGGRRGAQMATFDVSHPDVMEFIRAKREDGRLRQFNLSLLITDEFMQAVEDDSEWPLAFPITPKEQAEDGIDLSDSQQVIWRDWPTRERYLSNEQGLVACRIYRTIKARRLWDLIMSSTYDFAEPGFILIDRYNEMNNNWFCEDIRATNPCVTADTWVHTAAGPRQVQELLDTPFLARVDGVDHASGAEGFFKTATKPVLLLETREGYQLRLTVDHRVRRITRLDRYENLTEWCAAGDLQPGDRVLLNDHGERATWSGEHGLSEGYLMGLLLANGELSEQEARLHFERLQRAVGSELDQAVDPLRMQALNHAAQIGLAESADQPDGALSDATGSLSLPGMVTLAAEFGLEPGEGRITPEMERGSSDFYRGLLRALFDARGSFRGHSLMGIAVALRHPEAGQLRAVQRMLLRLGIVSRLYSDRPDRDNGLVTDITMLADKNSALANELMISGRNLQRFANQIGFSDEQRQARLTRDLKLYGDRLSRERFTVVVERLSNAGSEPVYDCQVPGINTFDGNGFHAHNCGEQGLPPYGACLLGSVNLTKFVRDPFSEHARFDWEAFRSVVDTFTRMLDNVVEVHGLPLPQQREEIERKRRHGMGYLGLGSTLTMLGMRYGGSDSLAFTEQVTRELALTGWRAALELAKEKGAAPIMEEEFEIDGEMLRRRPEMRRDGYKEGDRIKGRLLHAKYSRYMQQVAEVEPDLVNELAEVGARFTHHSSIAPTGTISLSLANNASNGIEPSFAHHYARNVIREGKKSKEKVDVYSFELLAYRALINPKATPESEGAERLPDYFVAADDITPREHVDVQAAAQKWIDSSISKTANVPTDYPYEEFKEIYLYAYRRALKGCTTFRFNPEAFQGVLVKEKDLENTTYRFTLEDGSVIEAKGNEEIEYDGELHTAANLYDALKEGYYGKF